MSLLLALQGGVSPALIITAGIGTTSAFGGSALIPRLSTAGIGSTSAFGGSAILAQIGTAGIGSTTTFGGSSLLAGIMSAGIGSSTAFGGSTVEFEGAAPAVVVSGDAGRAKRRRQPLIYRVFVKGRAYLFDDVESLVLFLERQELEAERRVAKVAEKDAVRIERVGRAASPPRPPLVRIRSEVPEVAEFITALQAKLDALYWRKLEGRLADEMAEDEDMPILAWIMRLHG